MLVSVVINTRNEEKNIEDCLRSILAQKYPKENIEIIVVDNNSTDRTKEIVKKYTAKVFNYGPERSAQKNFGIKESKGGYFLHLDADMRLSENIISECAEKFSRNKDTVALYIPEKIIGRGFWGKVRSFERSFYDGTAVDGVRFIKKDVFLEIGGFDENLYACEDWDLDKRIKKFGKVDVIDAVLYHNETEFNLKKYLAKKSYYAKNINVYTKKWGKSDPDIKKQFGFYYRFVGVFMENRKWKKLLGHPLLASGMYFLRILVGVKYLIRNKK